VARPGGAERAATAPRASLEAVERTPIERALKQAGQNKSKAAKV
jgi:transcriptional regulator with PAS, ATPase and Fis domain